MKKHKKLYVAITIEDVTVTENYIDFYCGGKGIGSETSYYGFYFSEDNAIDVKLKKTD